MCPQNYFIIYFVLISVESHSDNHIPRKRRIFTFNTEDEDIKIDLAFTIPFLSIPVKRTLNSMDFPTININPATLALGGAVVLGATILVPLLVKNYAQHQYNRRYTRILENAEFGSNAFLNLANEVMSDNRSLRGCGLRISCWAAQKKYSEPLKLFRLILNNKLLSNVINSTSLEDAMLSGISGRDCMTYSPCGLSEHYMSIAMGYLASNTTCIGGSGCDLQSG